MDKFMNLGLSHNFLQPIKITTMWAQRNFPNFNLTKTLKTWSMLKISHFTIKWEVLQVNFLYMICGFYDFVLVLSFSLEKSVERVHIVTDISCPFIPRFPHALKINLSYNGGFFFPVSESTYSIRWKVGPISPSEMTHKDIIKLNMSNVTFSIYEKWF